VTVIDDVGRVLARGEDRERRGDSLSSDALVQRVILGQDATSLVVKEGVLAPQIFIRAATPIKKGGQIIGGVITGVPIDTAFVDAIKRSTGLEASIYADNILSATTFTL